MLHRSIMLHAEDRIHALITRLRESAAPPERQALLDELTEIEASVHEVAHSVVDYQHVMDELDDNILVADKDEVVLYVNDAYIRHTGIAPEQILGKRITELLETGTYFTDPTVPEVIRSRKKVMKLSSMFGRPDSLGFVTGVPSLTMQARSSTWWPATGAYPPLRSCGTTLSTLWRRSTIFRGPQAMCKWCRTAAASSPLRW